MEIPGLGIKGEPGGTVVKNLPAMQEINAGSSPGSGRSPGEGNGNPLQYSCLENFHGQRSLVGYSPWGLKESDNNMKHMIIFWNKYWYGYCCCTIVIRHLKYYV